MPFFVYGTDPQTGEAAKRFVSDAQTADAARRAGEEHGVRVTAVVPCPPVQREGDERGVAAHAHVATPSGQISASFVRSAVKRAAKASIAQAYARPEAVEQPVSEMGAFDERLKQLTPSTWGTYALIGINVLVFAVMTLSGVNALDPTADDLVRWGAEFGPNTSDGQWWRLFSSMFVHIGIIHITSNMIAFAYVGPMIERMFGNLGFVLVYVVAGLGGSTLALLVNPMFVHAGASGAIFGIYGALFAVLLRERSWIPAGVNANLKRFLLIFIAYNLTYSLSPGISLSAHLGGMVTGFVCGLVVAQPLSNGDTHAKRSRSYGYAVALGLLVVAFGVFAVRTKYPGLDRVIEFRSDFLDVEHASRKAFADALLRSQHAQLGNDDFATLIEVRLLPEWRRVHKQADALSMLSKDLRNIDAYLEIRQQQLEGLTDALRRNDPDAVHAAMERGKSPGDRLSHWLNVKW
jgi:rhomboid protease GluP